MDPALQELLRDEEVAGDRMIESIIRLRRPGLEIPGVRIVSRFGQIATCRLATSSVLEVREHADVISLKAPRSFGPEYEAFLGDGRAGSASDLSHADCRRRPDLPLTGAGVVVGVVDWGLDFDHPNFKTPDGSTRLLALWDQRDNTTGASPQPYGYGTVHEQQQINQALRSLEPYRQLGYHPAAADRGGGSHGTHVMDIAAGNGRAGPAGVAPNADLVFVHLADRDTGGLANLGDSVRLLEAVHFIARTARDQPWVINFSVGRHGGPHDGKTLIELALDEFISATPGRFTVHSTGNYFRSRIHACGVLKHGQARTLSFVTDPADISANELEIWYDGNDEFTVCISPPGSKGGGQAVHLGGQAELLVDEQVVGRVYHRAYDPNNGDNHIDAFLFPRGCAGRWTVTIEAVHVKSGRFHAWLERDEVCKPCQARFVPDDSNSTCTTGTIANSQVPLVVGGYDAHSRSRPVAAFSSSGPTRDGRQKPDLVAPGVGVLAARSAPPGSVRSRGQLVRKSGSSMAAPHVTGAVALCLQAGGQRLDAPRIRALVLGTTDANTRTDSGYRLGRGYLDIPELVVAVQRAFPTPVRRDTKESAMDTELGATVPFALAPSRVYRELLYRPDGQVSQWIDTRFGIVARPGQRISDPPQAGDVMLQVTLGHPGAGTCSILVDPTLTRQRANSAHGAPGWYAAARDAAVAADPLQRRILDPSGYLPPGQLLLRPRTIDTVDDLATNHERGEDDTEDRTPVPVDVPDTAATETEQAAMATLSESPEDLAEIDEYLDQPDRAGDETEGEGPERAGFSAEVDPETDFEALSDLEGEDWVPVEADAAAEVSWPVKSKVVKGLLAAAKEWKLPLTEAGAEAIADEMSLGQASKLGEEAPTDKAAAKKLAAEKLAILRQITQSVIAKTKDQKLKKELQDLVAAVDKAASSPEDLAEIDEYLDQPDRAGDETEGEGPERAGFSAEVDPETDFEALSDLEGEDWVPVEAEADEGPSAEEPEDEEIDQQEAAAGELQPASATLRAARSDAKPEIVLVAGVDYPKFEQADKVWKRIRRLSAGPWRQYCLRVAEQRLKADPALIVTLFDFLLGTRERVTLDGKRRAVATVEQTFTAPTAKDYWNVVGVDLSHPTPAEALKATIEPADKSALSQKAQVLYFDGATAQSQGKPIRLWKDYLAAPSKVAAPVLSITDIYAYIEGFARAGKKGMLNEFHFFSHAFNISVGKFSGGPILLNSLDNPVQADRHPLDKDARAAKDFMKPTMDPAVFAQAFGPDARSFVWGCNFQRGFIRQFVHQVSKNSKTLAAGRSMKISYNPDWGTESEFRDRLGLSATASVEQVSVDAAKVEQIMQDTNQATYMQKLATASGRPVVGAPPGTYSDYDDPSSPLELLHVPMTKDPFRDAKVSFERALLYFRDHLKLRFDTSFGDHNGLGRGYIIYDP